MAFFIELKLAHDTFDELNFQTMAAKDAMSGAPQINTIRDVEILLPQMDIEHILGIERKINYGIAF